MTNSPGIKSWPKALAWSLVLLMLIWLAVAVCVIAATLILRADWP